MSAVVLRARGLTKRFGALSALRGVDLEVSSGTVHVILGPNGAGKTTLLRILAGLAHPSGGEVEIDVAGHWSPPRNARHEIGYVGHETLLYPELTASENLIFAGRLYSVGDPKARAATLLAEEGLLDVADRRAGTFSRGMAQRLSIARSRVHAPQILLLDEPFTGLDRRSADALATRLVDLRGSGHALVLITHDLRLAGEIADRADILLRGSIVQSCVGSEVSAERLELAYLAVATGPSRANGHSNTIAGGPQ